MQLLKQGDFSQHPDAATAVFSQDWLFFGVLYEVLGHRGQKKDFMRWDEESSKTLVTTKNLHAFLQARFLDYVQPPDTSWHQMLRDFERLDKVLQIASFFCIVASSKTVDDRTLRRPTWPLTPEIDFAIRALNIHLAASLYSAACDLGGSYSLTVKGFRMTSMTMMYPAGDYPASRMREAGWCPSEIAMLYEHMSPASLYYASSLRRFQIRKDHTKCTEQLCAANQVDTSTYKTAHATDHCCCEHIKVTIEQLVSIIAKEEIPVVTISINKESGQPKLEISRFRRGRGYVAISHVWSDGMGNAEKNSLPGCQVNRLKDLLDELTWSNGKTWDNLNKGHINKFFRRLQGRSIPFWMDTLCIPVEEQHKAYRTKSITKMHDIYRNAESVLILDSELQGAPMPLQPTEVFLRVQLSGWMRRLWTLQESVLGRRLYVKLQDGIFDLTTEHETNSKALKHPPSSFDWHAGTPSSDSRSFYWNDRVLRFLIVEKRERKFVGTFETHRSYMDPKEEKVMKECEAILRAFVRSNFRSTSRKSDEFRCLASLLGWDVTCLSGVPIERRMKALLQTKNILPQGLIFIAGQRIPEQGWRWALQSFGNNGSKQLDIFGAHVDATPATRSAEGLTVRYPGFIIAASQRPPHLDRFVVEVPKFKNEEPWILQVCTQGSGNRTWDNYDVNTNEGNKDIRRDLAPKALAIIFYSSNADYSSHNFLAAVVADVEQDGFSEEIDAETVVACTYRELAKIQVLCSKEAFASRISEPHDLAVNPPSSSPCTMRRWCVG